MSTPLVWPSDEEGDEAFEADLDGLYTWEHEHEEYDQPA